MIDRRRFLLQSGTASAMAASGLLSPAFARQNGFSKPLPIPPLLEGELKDGRRTYDLTISSGRSEFIQGLETPTIGFNGAYLGPTIHCRAGDKVTLRVRNGLGEATTVHWHGLHLPALFDGGPHQIVKAGATWEPAFQIKQDASLCWYHSHLMGRTGEQVLRGLAGLLLISPADGAKSGLPSDYGVDDIPLVVQDRRFQADGSFEYVSSMHDVMMGYFGNVILVNGAIAPTVSVRRKRTRLRILNGSNARIYNFGLDGREFVVIGSDGGLLERPSRQRTVRLAPGERTELLVDMAANETLRLAAFPLGDTEAKSNRGLALMELRAGQLEGDAPPLPKSLAAFPAWKPQTARTRTFELQMGMMGMGGGGMMGRGGIGGMMGGPGSMAINGRSMDPGYINERVKLGSVEIWEIRNATPLPHPFHIHNVQFRVLDRNGRPPLAQELGLKDTVLVEPRSAVRVITEFATYSDSAHPYMYHCHNLEHEDAGMMGQFVVV
jgi:FtsP/CotA-like multicopper oxidase with cupredoxin domain